MPFTGDEYSDLNPELVARVRAMMEAEQHPTEPHNRAEGTTDPPDNVVALYHAVDVDGEAAPTKPATSPLPPGPPSIRRLHALTHRQSADVYADRGMPGELVVEYLRSEALDPHIKTTLDRLQAEGDEVAMTDFMADYLERVLYSWNLAEPLTRDNIIALRPLIMQDIMLALVKERNEKKG